MHAVIPRSLFPSAVAASLIGLVSLAFALVACGHSEPGSIAAGAGSAFADRDRNDDEETTHVGTEDSESSGSATAVATFGAGCFWCVEAVFERLDGVKDVVSGYSGGHVANPTYEQICRKTTGHAEVCQITYDPEVVSFVELLEVFWQTHDPTTKNRQGNDLGPQYRSIILYHDDEQKELAASYLEKLDASGAFDNPIVTEIVPFEKFWVAEKKHQNYFELNPDQGYCAYVIAPKVDKFQKVFKGKLKKGAKK